MSKSDQFTSTSSAGSAPGLLHLLYHEVRPVAAAYSYVTSTELFQQHVELYAKLLASASPVAPVVTFDDGHVSNHDLAAPLLASRGITAHFFLTVGWLAHRSGYMDWSQVRALHQAGHAIGAHGWSHTLLTHCSPTQLDIELSRSRLTLEDRLGSAVTTMSLPGGRANRRVLEACRSAGYEHVYTSVPRVEHAPATFCVGRLNVRGNTSPEWLDQLFAPSSPQLARQIRTHRFKSAMQSVIGDRLYASLWALINRSEPEAGEFAGNDNTHPSSGEERSS